MISLSTSCVCVLNIGIGNENGKISKSFCFSSITLFSPSPPVFFLHLWIVSPTTSQPIPVFLHLHVHAKSLKAPFFFALSLCKALEDCCIKLTRELTFHMPENKWLPSVPPQSSHFFKPVPTSRIHPSI